MSGSSLSCLPAALFTHCCTSFLDVPTLFARLAPCCRSFQQALCSRTPGAPAAVLQRLLLKRLMDRWTIDAWIRAHRLEHEPGGDEDEEAEERQLMRALIRLRGAAESAMSSSSLHSDGLSAWVDDCAGFPPLSDLQAWCAPSTLHAAGPTYYDLLRQLYPLGGLVGHWRASLANSASWPLGRYVSVHWDAVHRQLVAVDRMVHANGPSAHRDLALPPARHLREPWEVCLLQIAFQPYAGQQAQMTVPHWQLHESQPQVTQAPVHVRILQNAQKFEVKPAGDWRSMQMDFYTLHVVPTYALRSSRHQLPLDLPVTFTRLPMARSSWASHARSLPPSLASIYARASLRASSVFFVPPVSLPAPGLWTAQYGAHGPELFMMQYAYTRGTELRMLQSEEEDLPIDEHPELPDLHGTASQASTSATMSDSNQSASSSAASDGSLTASDSIVSSSATLSQPATADYVLLRACKVLGDSNVPAGKVSWSVLVGPVAEVREQCEHDMEESRKKVLTAEAAAMAGSRADSASSAALSAKRGVQSLDAAELLEPVQQEQEQQRAEAPTVDSEMLSDDEMEEHDPDEDAEDAESDDDAHWGESRSGPPPAVVRRLAGKGLIAGAGHTQPRLIPLSLDVLNRQSCRLHFLGRPVLFHPFLCACPLHEDVLRRSSSSGRSSDVDSHREHSS